MVPVRNRPVTATFDTALNREYLAHHECGATNSSSGMAPGIFKFLERRQLPRITAKDQSRAATPSPEIAERILVSACTLFSS
jgi:hypothetical protein